jgi:G:T-mismatch repair DNA endonuclease (very short patch repair protein)
MMSGMKVSPNKSETIMLGILNENFPNQWEFVGDRSFYLGRLNPDFVDRTNKYIIECFGTYWHKDGAKFYHQTSQGRIEYYDKYGYKTLILWENEIKRRVPKYVIEKVKEYFGIN